MATAFPSPGVYIREIDLSTFVSSLADTGAYFVGTFPWGEPNVTKLVTNHGQLFTGYGNFTGLAAGVTSINVKTSRHPALYAISRYLRKGRRAYVTRVCDPAAIKKSQYWALDASSGVALKFVGLWPGTYGDNIRIEIAAANTTNYKKLLLKLYNPNTLRTSDLEGWDKVDGDSQGFFYYGDQINVVQASQFIRLNDVPPTADNTSPSVTPNPPTTALTPTPANDAAGKLIVGKTYHVAYSWYQAGGRETLPKAVPETTTITTSNNAITVTVPTIVANATGIMIYAGLNSNELKYIGSSTTPGAFVIKQIGPQLVPVNSTAGSPFALAGGADGDVVTDAQVVGTAAGGASQSATGLKIARDANRYDVAIVAAPGISSTAVSMELLALAEGRSDCLALLDPPFGLSVDNVINHHNGVAIAGQTAQYYTSNGAAIGAGGLDSSYGAMFYPWGRVLDDFTGDQVWIPPSSFALEAMAFTDFIADPWYAAAGPNRGQITDVLDMEVSLSIGEMNALYSGGNVINPIPVYFGQGVEINGNRTLKRIPSALDRIHVRRLLNTLRRLIGRSIRGLVFEPNDEIMWRQFEGLVNPILQAVKARRGLREFRAQMDASTTLTSSQENSQAVGRIFLKPVLAAEVIVVEFVVTAQGVTFSETITTNPIPLAA